MRLLISGANGFVGKSLTRTLMSHAQVVTHIRRDNLSPDLFSDHYECLIHLAGRAHVMHETTSDIYQAYKAVNVDYTLKIAQLAKSLRIKRFILLSSVKVNGEISSKPFTELDAPAPVDAYGLTKLEAEIAVKEFCTINQIELVIIRAPLIYGPGAKANFKSLMSLCRKPIPLPFGNIRNKRSLVSLENLNSFIELCCYHPEAANQTFLISDDHDVSTSELINTIRASFGQRAFQLPVPHFILRKTLDILGKPNLNERLLGNLQVDICKAKQLLHWKPVVSFEEGIKQTVSEYAD